MTDLTAAPVRAELSAKSVLSYAMANIRIPVIDRLSLISAVDAQGARLRLAVHDEQGPVTQPFERLVDLVAGERTVLDTVGLVADPATMLQIEEQRPASIVVEVEHDGRHLATAREPIRLLAARQWLRVPELLSLEVLASFVMPHDPAVAGLLDEAAAILLQRTGSSSMQGYQAGPERVDAQVQAIFEAMQARGIRYGSAPASWADIGQKIRTPTEVLTGRTGTCLDTVVVMAAILEQTNIRPLLWVVDGHAFLGYWRQESALDAIAQADVSDVVNLVDLDLIRLVETTMVTQPPSEADFAGSSRPPYLGFLTGDLDQVLGVTDVWTARRNGIIPLPARRSTDDGQVVVVEYKAGEHSTVQASRAERDPAVQGASGTAVPARVQQWKNALLDLSLRNRLINYSDRYSVVLHVPDGHLGAVEDLLHEGRALHLLPSDQFDEVHLARGSTQGRDLPQGHLEHMLTAKQQLFTSQSAATYQSRMRSLAYKARTIVEESGANNLYLALGSLVWELDGRALKSPLVLVPVRLVSRAKTTAYRLELDESGASTPNYCLLEKLHQVHGMRIPGLAEPAADGAGIDLDQALQAVRVAIAERRLPYRVEPTADVAILQFAKFRLWKDLDENWEAFSANSLVHHLIHSQNDPFEPPQGDVEAQVDLDELDANCPVPGDASQLQAVADAVAGRTFVLEGPPGTGKSQTITNLLTRAVAEGRRVLFVAEKRAALDVVRRRLDSVGMEPFCLDLHDKGSKPAVVRAQIKRALEHEVAIDVQGLGAQEEQLRASRRTLARYADRLHDQNEVGQSFYSAHTQQLALGPGPTLPVAPTFLAAPDAADRAAHVRKVLRDLPDTADLARPSIDHPWGFVQLEEVAAVVPEQVRGAVRNVDKEIDALPIAGPVVQALLAVHTADDLSTLAAIAGAPSIPLQVLDQTRTPRWAQASADLGQHLRAFVSAAHPSLGIATPAALDLPLADIHAEAQAAAASGWFGRKKRLSQVAARLSPALRPGVEVTLAELPQLTGVLLQIQRDVRSLGDRAGGVPGLQVPAGWNPLIPEGQRLIEAQVAWLGWAGGAVDEASGSVQHRGFVAALRRFMDEAPRADPAAATVIARLAAALRQVEAASNSDGPAFERWAADGGLLRRWVATRQLREVADPTLQGLRRWVAFRGQLAALQSADLHEAHEALLEGTIAAEDAVAAFDRGLAQASTAERRAITGLDRFDPPVHNRTIHRFTASSSSVRRQMTSAVPYQVLARRPFQPSTARGQAGALQRELTRQRGGMGVRKLLSTYGELVTQIMPCVLVSPDSLSRFFPVGQQTFDLVVFDEASQIRVADAIGAMGRSRSVVVVGDSKQLPPTSFAEASLASSDDDEELAAEDMLVPADEESILTECVQARVPRRWLSWHYRSQDESLIAFSNRHYYEDRLSSFPAPTGARPHAGLDGFGISLVPVAGKFHRTGKGRLLRTNPEEAEAVVAEIRRRFDAFPDRVPSIGVVTFNAQQRAYIEGLLRDTQDERLISALDGTEEGIFVKNLENVQGDERDVILFSTAFSVNEKGQLPLNFGPLNRAGGERRLNVAITRARRQVIIFTSFAPGDLRAEETSSVGIKHLRHYLDLAARGVGALQTAARAASVPDRHRQQLAAALRERGLLVQEDVGLSDFKVELSLSWPENPERLLVAVLLDGEGWRRRGTVGDRDGLPVLILSKMLRWPAVERVWLPEWLATPEVILDRLEQVARQAAELTSSGPSLEVALPRGSDEVMDDDGPSPFANIWTPDAGPSDVPAQIATAPAPMATASAKAASMLLAEEPFVPWVPQPVGGRDVLDGLPRTGAPVRRLIEEIVAAEGPVHLERLSRLVAASFGLTRVAEARAAAIAAVVPSRLLAGRDELFAWPADRAPQEWKGFRRAIGDQALPLEHVSLREIGNAMVAIARASFEISGDELLREALAVFGGRRMTGGIERRLQTALVDCLQRRQLVELNGVFRVSEVVG